MNILIVTNMYPHDGYPFNGIFVFEQIKAIEKRYKNVSFDVCFIDGSKTKMNYIKSIFKLNYIIWKRKYDLVHIHFGLSGLYLLCPFRKRVPTLVTFHGSDIQIASTHNYWIVKISKIVAKKVDASITLNDGMDSLVRSLGCTTYKIPCSVDTSIFGMHDNETGKREGKVRIVFPSSRDRQVKNYPLFRKTIKILSSKYNVETECFELKNMSRVEIAELYGKVDLMLLTSKSEGSPQVIKEAMSCNLPCVCTPVGDVAYLLEGVKNCYVSQHHDADELADLCYKSLYHEGNGISGRDKIMKLGLDEDTISKKIYGVYNELINKR